MYGKEASLSASLSASESRAGSDKQRPAELFAMEEEEEFIGEDALNFEEALAAPEDVQEDPYYFVRASSTAKGDIWYAARIGDNSRVRELVEEGIDPNQRDRWDSTPLYYACLTGHLEVAQRLLDAGASCSEYTFDGERCFYVALTAGIRQLLSAYAQRPPPLPPLGTALRALSSLCEDLEAQVAPPFSPGEWADFAFEMGGRQVPLHRAILAARSPFFRHMLETSWRPQIPGQPRVVRLEHRLHALCPNALRSLLVWCYTERLEVAMADVEAVERIAKRCHITALVTALEAEQRTLKHYFKTVKREEQPRRFVLQPSALPQEERLSAGLGSLLRQSERLAARVANPLGSAEDFADVCLRVEGRVFRCHRCILAARSDYFAALFKRGGHFGGDGGDLDSPEPSGNLETVEIVDVSPKAFSVLLRFVYTDRPTDGAGRLPGWLLRKLPEGFEELCDAADRFLVFALKREVAEAMIASFEQRPQLQGGLEGICRLLLVADMYSVTLLRDHCLQRLAARFNALASRTAPIHESALFSHFLQAVAPKEGDLLDGSTVKGASKGSITGGGVGGAGIGTLLQDLREAYLEDFGGLGPQRDRCARQFDADLANLAHRARQRERNEET